MVVIEDLVIVWSNTARPLPELVFSDNYIHFVAVIAIGISNPVVLSIQAVFGTKVVSNKLALSAEATGIQLVAVEITKLCEHIHPPLTSTAALSFLHLALEAFFLYLVLSQMR